MPVTMELQLGQPLGTTMADLFVRIALAVVLSGALGLERQHKRRPAGLRTHILVCLGATLVMSVSDMLANQWNTNGTNVWLDRGRMAAGIITGVGFLGAGTIINVGREQMGLTTAAMIWFVAALGIAIGAGFYLTAILATLAALILVIFLSPLETRMPAWDSYTLRLRVSRGEADFETIEQHIRRTAGFNVRASRIRFADDANEIDVTFQIEARSAAQCNTLIASIRESFPSARKFSLER